MYPANSCQATHKKGDDSMATLEPGLVISNEQLAADLFELELIAPQTALLCQPGQFLQIRIDVNHDPLLRRPISVYDVNQERGTISLLYKVVGRGTNLLTAVKAQEYLDIMGPLGKGFSLPDTAGRVVLVGGGVGIAPLLYLARRLQEMKCEVTVLYGAGSSKDLAAAQRFENLGVELLTATMDGSQGCKGLVTDLLRQQIKPEAIDRVYTCGPEIMMAAVADFAVHRKIWGECSLEENMACAVGACLGCARKLKSTDPGYVKVCKDGPVFSLHDIELYNGGLA